MELVIYWIVMYLIMFILKYKKHGVIVFSDIFFFFLIAPFLPILVFIFTLDKYHDYPVIGRKRKNEK
jgi:hypothetical protein